MNPCYSGFQVQGTATAPTGMAPSDTPNHHLLSDVDAIITSQQIYYNRRNRKKQVKFENIYK